jgi:epsilon-lactone hydrolase
MSSWQNRALCAALKAKLKRRPDADDARNVRMARTLIGVLPFYMKPTVPAGLAVRRVDDDGFHGEWLEWRSGVRPATTILYLHGGGYIACSPETHRPLTFALTETLRARTFALDYRLAPEHPFPAALDDAVAAYDRLLATGVNPREIVIIGDSAGGGLTLAALVALRDRKRPLPKAAICLSPWTDLAVTGNSLRRNEHSDAMFYGESIRRVAPLYAGSVPATHPLVSPLYAELGGLPPLLIFASDSEVLLDDAVRFADRARRSGVSIDLQIWHDLPHVWPLFVRFLPEARQAIRQMAAFIRRNPAPVRSLPNARQARSPAA